MAIAHLCTRCGWDLARIHPVREPHYGLRIVTCPRCQRVAVRRRHPVWQRWHQFRGADWSLTVVAMQLILAVLLGFLTTVCIPGVIFNAAPWIGWQIFERGRVQGMEDQQLREIVWLCFWVFGVLSPATGAWLAAGFSHLRLWKVWASWAGLMLMLQVLLAFYFIVATSDGDVFPIRLRETLLAERLTIAVMFVAPGALVLAIMMITALLGIPFGKAWLWLARTMRSTRWRFRRKLRKQARTA